MNFPDSAKKCLCECMFSPKWAENNKEITPQRIDGIDNLRDLIAIPP